MSKTTLTNTLPITVVAVVGEENNPESKEIQFIESFAFNLSWTMYASVLDSDMSLQELSIRQNQAYQKIVHLCTNYLNNSIWYDVNDLKVIQNNFSSSQNILLVTPANNVMYLASCLFAKFNSICDDHIFVNKIELYENSTGLKYTIEDDEGLLPDILPEQADFMGPLSVYEKPWWERGDVSTYDNRALDEDELKLIREKLDESKELLEEDFKQIEKDVETYMSATPEEVAEVIDLEQQRVKNKTWTPKVIK